MRTIRPHIVAIGGDGAFSWEGENVDVIEGGDSDEVRQSFRLQGKRNDDGTLGGTRRAETGYYNGEADSFDSQCATAATSRSR